MSSSGSSEHGAGLSRPFALVSLAAAAAFAVWMGFAVVGSNGIVTVLAALAVPPSPEPVRMARIGYLGSLEKEWPAPLGRPRVETFRDGLREQGYVEGQNIHVDYRFAGGDFARLPDLASELVRLRVDVIVLGDTRAIRFARDATTKIPLVMTLSSDPVRTGFATTLHRPGGNLTGLTMATTAVDAKRLELFKELVPGLQRVAVLWERNDVADLEWEGARIAAQILGLELVSYEVKTGWDIGSVVDQMAEDEAHGVFVFGTPSFGPLIPRIADAARQRHLPLAGTNVEWVQAGALMTYVPDYDDLYRRAALHVRRILNGADPAALPIEQPARFDLAVNLTTAEGLGLEVPRSIGVRATEVIR